MASTYSPALRLELMATGDQSGTWGDTTNTNLGTLLEQAITGYLSVAQGDVANLTLTTVNGGSDQARNAVIRVTGALTATRNVVVQTANKMYVIVNATTGGFSIVAKTAAGTGVSIPPGASVLVYSDGTNVVQAANYANGQIGGMIYLDSGATVGPVMDLFRDSTSPAASDIMGSVVFYGRDSAANKQEYAGIEAVIVDATSTSEDGQLDFYATKAGTRTKFASMTAAATALTGAAAYSADAPLTVSSTAAGAVATLTSTEAGAGLGPTLDLYRNSASPAANDVIGGVRFYGVDAGAAQELYGRLQATIVDTTAGSEDAFLSLSADLAGTLTNYMHWGANAAGTATPNAVGLPLGQLSFPATQNASADANTLDDYEEGTFTVGIYDASSAGNQSPTTATGYYTKIGNVVTVAIRIDNIDTTGMTAGNALYISLPFAAKTDTQNAGSASLDTVTFAGSVVPVAASAATRIVLRQIASGAADANLTVAGLSTGVSDIAALTITYLT